MITFDNVSKRYPDGTVAVDGLTITAPAGRITTLVGPSGCGKTTSMRMINRLIEPTSGTIELRGCRHPEPRSRRTAQADRLRHPERGAVPPSHRRGQRRGTSAPARRQQEGNAFGSNGTPRARRAGRQIRQTVSVAVVRGTAAAGRGGPCACDRPAVPADGRAVQRGRPDSTKSVQDEFLRLQADISKTIVMVTHDIDEALKLGDQVVVLRQGGTLAQAATPARAAGRTERYVRRRFRRFGPRLPGAGLPELRQSAGAVRRADHHGRTAGFGDPFGARTLDSGRRRQQGAHRLGRSRRPCMVTPSPTPTSTSVERLRHAANRYATYSTRRCRVPAAAA